MSGAHTKVAWAIEHGSTASDPPKPDGWFICTSDGVAIAWVEDEEVARLIAAAPETLDCTELLESLCAWLLHRFGPDSPEGREATFRLEKARAAILKAQGGE